MALWCVGQLIPLGDKKNLAFIISYPQEDQSQLAIAQCWIKPILHFMSLVKQDLMEGFHNLSRCRFVFLLYFKHKIRESYLINTSTSVFISKHFILLLQVKDSKTHFTVANTTNMRRAAFTVTGLVPGTEYIIVIDSSNSKGKIRKCHTIVDRI